MANFFDDQPQAQGSKNFFDDEEQPGFGARVSADNQKRMQKSNDIAQSGDTLAEKALQIAGQGAGIVNDTIGEAGKSIANYTPQSVKDALGQAASFAGQIPASALINPMQTISNRVAGIPDPTLGDLGNAAGAGIKAVGEGYQQLEAVAPRLTRNLDAAGNIVAVTGLPAAGKAGQVAGDAIEAASKVAPVARETAMAAESPVARAIAETAAATPKIYKNTEVFNEARKGYKFAEQAGVKLNPNSVRNAVEEAAQSIKPKGTLALDKPDLASEYIDHLRQRVGTNPLSFDDVVGLDQELTAHIKGMYNPATSGYTAEGQRLKTLRDSLRDMMTTAAEKPEGHILGGDARGIQAYQQATGLWAKAIKLKSFENVVERGLRTQQPASSLRTGAKNFLLNDKKMAGLNAETKAAIANASEKGFIGDRAANLGSRLIPIGGIVGGGVPGYLAGEGLSSAARGLATKLQMNRLNKVLELLSKDGKFIEPTVAENVADTTQKLLPAPQQEFIADAAGQTRPASPAEFADAAAARQRAEELGLTPYTISELMKLPPAEAQKYLVRKGK